MAFSLRCLLMGHDDRLARSPARLWLLCDHCGRETTGWQLGPLAVRASPLRSQHGLNDRKIGVITKFETSAATAMGE